jgi:transcriptional regulator with XRE-family HTH domain
MTSRYCRPSCSEAPGIPQSLHQYRFSECRYFLKLEMAKPYDGGIRAMTYKGRFSADGETQHCANDSKSALSVALAKNLRQLRQKRGFSLERFSKISQVSRAMLGQIETGKSTPTINTVALIARALKVSISTLLTGEMPLTTVVKVQAVSTDAASAEEGPSSRVIAEWRDLSGAEIHEISLAQGRSKSFAPASEGIKKSLVVTAGTLGIEIDDEPPVTLSDGDAIIFCANQNHALRNVGLVEAKALLVISGVDRFNWQEEPSLPLSDAADGLTEKSDVVFDA